MGKILGIDYGKKRIGLSVSDESQTFARELNILSPKEFWQSINKIIKDQEIGEIVLGLPLNMSGKETKITLEVKKFKQELEDFVNLKVNTIDERLSSEMTGALPGGHRNKDSLAAQIILQNYLNSVKRIADSV